jgi:UDP-N-acetylglucosamine 2-epimerase (non-hydrolysing)
VHPRTRAALDAQGIDAPGATEPVGYIEFLRLVAGAAAVLTDSGGIQEETTYLGVPCFTLRDNTERPITVELGTNRLVGVDPRKLAEAAREALDEAPPASPPEIPLWDGKAGPRAAGAVIEFMASS